MTSRRLSALRAGSQMPQTDGEICCIVSMPLLSQTLHYLCAWMEAEVLLPFPSFLQAGKRHGEAARDCLSGEGCAELNHVHVLLAKQHIVSPISWCSGHLLLLGPWWCSKNSSNNTIKDTNISRSTSMEPWPSSMPRNSSPSRSHLGHANVPRLITQGYRLWKRKTLLYWTHCSPSSRHSLWKVTMAVGRYLIKDQVESWWNPRSSAPGTDKVLYSFISHLLQVRQKHSLALPSLTKRGKMQQDCFMHWLEDAAEYGFFP